MKNASDTRNAPPALVRRPEGLTLEGGGLTLRADFEAMLPRLKRDRLNRELRVRAARIRQPLNGTPTAVDATAGLGEDALLLAAAGFAVRLFERDPVIAALLADALERAARNPELAGAVARMTLTEGDCIPYLEQLTEFPDVVLLDPMFPERKKSGLVKKKFQLLHGLEAPAADEEALLMAARRARPQKIIIKRPLKGPYLAGVRPTSSLSGRAIRYDCLALPRGEASAPGMHNTPAAPL